MERSCTNCWFAKVSPCNHPCNKCNDYSMWMAKTVYCRPEEYVMQPNDSVHRLVKQMLNEQYGARAFERSDEMKRIDHLDSLYYGSKAWRDTMQLFMDKHDYVRKPKIEKVIFNDPATIVFWSDNTKTVVKAEGELFDPEKGLAMAISKKALGNQGNYYEEFKKWI